MDRDAVEIGKTGRAYALPVEHGKLREFTRAIGETSIDPDDPAAVIPPTFLATAMWWEHEDSNPLLAANLDPARMLHEQEYVAAAAGRERADRTATDLGHVGAGRSARREHDLRVRDHRVLGRVRRARGRGDLDRDQHLAGGDVVTHGPVTPIVLQPPPPATYTGPLTVTDFVVYQGASGDLASIHHDYDVARAAGYDKPFAPGMYPAGVLASWATAWLGARNIRRYKVRFANMVWPGDVLRCDGVVAATEAGADETTVVLELTCRAWDTIVVRGWATFVVPTADLAEPPSVTGAESAGPSAASA